MQHARAPKAFDFVAIRKTTLVREIIAFKKSQQSITHSHANCMSVCSNRFEGVVDQQDSDRGNPSGQAGSPDFKYFSALEI